MPHRAVRIVAVVAAVVVVVGGILIWTGGPSGHHASRLTKVNLLWEGDSQSAPIALLPATADLAVDRLHDIGAVHTYATGGAQVQTLVIRAGAVDAARNQLHGATNLLVVWVGENDLGFGVAPEAVHDQLAAYCQARRAAGWKVVVVTALPRTSPPDVPGYEARRQAFDDLMAMQWKTYADGFADVRDDPSIGAAGAQDDPKLYGPDHTHLTVEGRKRAAALVVDAFAPLGIH